MKKIMVALALLLLLTACTSHSARERLRAQTESQRELHEQVQQDDELRRKGATGFAENERIVISSARLKMEMAKPDSLQNILMALAKKYSGYVLSSGRDVTTIRVLAIHFKDAILQIEQLGKVKDKHISGEDVTEEYRDLEIRLDSAEKTRKRYLELLNKAEKVEEILKIEREIERLNGEIDLLKGKINRLAHLAQYATITIETSNGVKKGVLGYAFYSVYSGVKWLFVR